jgi:hypothetical protein
MTSEFDKMTKTDLRAYLVAHPNDQSAFYAFVDRYTADASSKTDEMPQLTADIQQIDRLIQEKVAQTKR